MNFGDAAQRAAYVAAAILSWRPNEFWAATPAELVTALGIDRQAVSPPATAQLLRQMMEQFPDGERKP